MLVSWQAGSEQQQEQPLITVPLRRLTIISEMIITVTLVLYLVVGCATIEGMTCSLSDLPMISSILKHHIYDRIFVFQITFHSVFVFYPNVRSFYARFGPLLPANTNTLLYWLGVLASVTPPLIGIFDQDIKAIHGTVAVLFYVSSALYVYFFVSALKSLEPGVLTPRELQDLGYLEILRSIISAIIVLGLTSALIFHSRGPTPYFEWVGTIILLNIFSLMAFLNPDVEVVMPMSQLKA